MSGPRGNLDTVFTVPAAQPGTYLLTLDVLGVPHASAKYVVASRASISAEAGPDARGEAISVTGTHFLPRSRLVLIAYPVAQGRKPIVLGSVSCSQRGAFRFRATTRKLAPGQYTLGAWSTSALTAQMAETFFQVVV
jgi:hypothetical protein